MRAARSIVLVTGLAAALSACSMLKPPADLDLALTKPSSAARYVVAIRPAVPAVKLQQIHAWHVNVHTPDGRAVEDAQFVFSGGMPQHFHGFPTQPRVTQNLGKGSYRLDGVKYSMTGWWEMKFDIATPDGKDHVVFNTVLTEQGLAKTAADYQ
jgi:hypothetical protein